MINVWDLQTTHLLLQSFPHWKVNRIEARIIWRLEWQFDKPSTQDGKRASKQLRHVNAVWAPLCLFDIIVIPKNI